MKTNFDEPLAPIVHVVMNYNENFGDNFCPDHAKPPSNLTYQSLVELSLLW